MSEREKSAILRKRSSRIQQNLLIYFHYNILPFGGKIDKWDDFNQQGVGFFDRQSFDE